MSEEEMCLCVKGGSGLKLLQFVETPQDVFTYLLSFSHSGETEVACHVRFV